MSDVNDIWDDEEDNEMVREMFGRRKAKDDYEHVNKPSKWIADKDAEITRLRADNEKLRKALEFYGWEEHWVKQHYERSVIEDDRGRHARAALEGVTEPPTGETYGQ